jgi:hypothetical protein
MKLFDTATINAYINGLTAAQLKKAKHAVRTYIPDHIYDTETDANHNLLPYILHMSAAVLDGRIDVLEWIICTQIYDFILVKTAFVVACVHNIQNVFDYLATILPYESDNEIFLASLEKKKYGNEQIVKHLMQFMSDLSDWEMAHVVRYGKMDILESALQIRKRKYKIKLVDAICSKNRDLIAYVETTGKITNRDLIEAFIECACKGNVDLAQHFIASYNFDVQRRVNYCASIAAYRGHQNFLDYLVRAHNFQIDGDTNILWNAVHSGNIDMCKYLVNNGAKINGCRRSSIRAACYQADFEILSYLLSIGPDFKEILCGLRTLSWRTDPQYNQCRQLLKLHLVKNLPQRQTKIIKTILTFAQEQNYTDIVKKINKKYAPKVINV